MKNINLASILTAGLIAASSCTPVHAFADDEFNRAIDRIQRDRDRIEQAQDRYLRQSDEGYRQLQERFDRETMRNNQLGQEAERQYIEKQRRERRGY